MTTVCVFCGSRSGGRPLYAAAARQLGVSLVARGMDLVYGGGHVGLMGVVADAVLSAGGRAVGVIVQSLVDRELAHQGLTELLVVDTMHQRKALMAERADAFVALPGGYGTGDELFEILTWAQLGFHTRPIGLLNTAGYFDPLLTWLDHMVQEDFLRPRHRELLLVADNADQVLDRLRQFKPGPTEPKWTDKT
jgi:uncharacterized protein (TIGR00730 family)